MSVMETGPKDKTFLITGGTSGVGKAVATGLAKLGAKIVIVSRTAESGRSALADISAASRNERGDFLVADLSLQSSIRAVSQEFKRKHNELHVLANLAGSMDFEKRVTPEGFDQSLAVNYLDHFLLTHELLDILRDSKPARVLTVAGAPGFLKKPTIDFEDFQLKSNFSGMKAATQALHARTLFAFELAKRLKGSGVVSLAFHPGLIKSRLVREAPAWMKVYNALVQPMAKTDCDVGVYLATANEVENHNGAFYDNKKNILPIFEGYDEKIGARLWRTSEELTRPK